MQLLSPARTVSTGLFASFQAMFNNFGYFRSRVVVGLVGK
jgi:hypothetical protein